MSQETNVTDNIITVVVEIPPESTVTVGIPGLQGARGDTGASIVDLVVNQQGCLIATLGE